MAGTGKRSGPVDKSTGSIEDNRDIILASHTIDRFLHHKLTNLLHGKKSESKSCTFFLTTFGGDPQGGYRIARCLRHYYDHVKLVVPSICKSAGTLIAICADELAIGDLGELGPLDIQVSKPSEIQERSSGLDIIQALEMINQHGLKVFKDTLFGIRFGTGLSTRMAGEFATKMAVGAVESLYAQIDPNKLGEMQRAMRITYDYGARLDRYTNNLRENALNRLVAEYPSHAFVIDRKEAKEIFKKVDHPTDTECQIAESHWSQLVTETGFGPAFVDTKKNTGGDDEQTEHD